MLSASVTLTGGTSPQGLSRSMLRNAQGNQAHLLTHSLWKRRWQWLHGRGCGGALFWLHGVSTGREAILIVHSGCPARALASHALAHRNGPCSLVAHSVWPAAGCWHKFIPSTPTSWDPQHPSSPEAKGRCTRQAVQLCTSTQPMS